MKKFLEKLIGYAKRVNEWIGTDGWSEIMLGALVTAALGWIRPLTACILLSMVVGLSIEYARNLVRDEETSWRIYACYVIGVVCGLAIIALNSIR